MFKDENYYGKIRRILVITLLLNLLVAIIKIAYGFHSNILSISADGYDSLFDGISNIVGILAITMASRPGDAKHPYGYSKIETLSAVMISLLLFYVSFEIITSAIARFNGVGIPNVTYDSFIIMIITLVINIFVARYEYSVGKKLQSDLLISDSKHTRSDVLATIAILLSLIFIKMGYPILDPILSIIIALLIIKTAFEILFNNLNVLIDKSIIAPEDVLKVLEHVDGINEVHNIRTRGTNSNVFLDMHLVVDDNLNIKQAHKIAHICEDELKSKYPQIEDVLIHLESSDGRYDKIEYEHTKI